MFKQYFKQAIHALRENRLTSLVSILGTMLSVAMILVVVLQFQIKLVGYSPVSKRDRMLYIYSVNTKSITIRAFPPRRYVNASIR